MSTVEKFECIFSKSQQKANKMTVIVAKHFFSFYIPGVRILTHKHDNMYQHFDTFCQIIAKKTRKKVKKNVGVTVDFVQNITIPYPNNVINKSKSSRIKPQYNNNKYLTFMTDIY